MLSHSAFSQATPLFPDSPLHLPLHLSVRGLIRGAGLFLEDLVSPDSKAWMLNPGGNQSLQWGKATEQASQAPRRRNQEINQSSTKGSQLPQFWWQGWPAVTEKTTLHGTRRLTPWNPDTQEKRDRNGTSLRLALGIEWDFTEEKNQVCACPCL